MHYLSFILELINYAARLTVHILYTLLLRKQTEYLNFMDLIAYTRDILPLLSLVSLHVLDPAILIQR
jgi:hypothetical protein